MRTICLPVAATLVFLYLSSVIAIQVICTLYKVYSTLQKAVDIQGVGVQEDREQEDREQRDREQRDRKHRDRELWDSEQGERELMYSE